VLDISKVYEEINIFDSILSPVMTGIISINDSIGLSGKLIFDGSEVLLVNIGKDTDSASFRLKKAFRIYKQSERKNLTQNSETYNLEFVSDEFIFSDQQRINQAYKTTYTDIVQKILVNYLKAPSTKLNGLFENTSGIREIVIPNLKPLEAIEWCAKRSIDEKKSPNYVFFENNLGYNYASLSTLLSQNSLFNIKFSAKNLNDTNAVNDLLSPRSYEVINQTDKIEHTRSGVNAGTFIGFDPITRSIGTKRIGCDFWVKGNPDLKSTAIEFAPFDYWALKDLVSEKVVYNQNPVSRSSEELLPEYGISIRARNGITPGSEPFNKIGFNGALESTYIFNENPLNNGLSGYDGYLRQDKLANGENYYALDPLKNFNSFANGTWAPYALGQFARSIKRQPNTVPELRPYQPGPYVGGPQLPFKNGLIFDFIENSKNLIDRPNKNISLAKNVMCFSSFVAGL
jgi:hypothetical protein